MSSPFSFTKQLLGLHYLLMKDTASVSVWKHRNDVSKSLGAFKRKDLSWDQDNGRGLELPVFKFPFQMLPGDRQEGLRGLFVFSAFGIGAVASPHPILIIPFMHSQMWIVTPDSRSLIKMANARGVPKQGPGCCLKAWSIITDWHFQLNYTRTRQTQMLPPSRGRKLRPKG